MLAYLSQHLLPALAAKPDLAGWAVAEEVDCHRARGGLGSGWYWRQGLPIDIIAVKEGGDPAPNIIGEPVAQQFYTVEGLERP